jgi:hypothetical protein
MWGKGNDAHNIEEKSQFIRQYTTDLLKLFVMAIIPRLGFAQVNVLCTYKGLEWKPQNSHIDMPRDTDIQWNSYL